MFCVSVEVSVSQTSLFVVFVRKSSIYCIMLSRSRTRTIVCYESEAQKVSGHASKITRYRSLCLQREACIHSTSRYRVRRRKSISGSRRASSTLLEPTVPDTAHCLSQWTTQSAVEQNVARAAHTRCTLARSLQASGDLPTRTHPIWTAPSTHLYVGSARLSSICSRFAPQEATSFHILVIAFVMYGPPKLT